MIIVKKNYNRVYSLSFIVESFLINNSQEVFDAEEFVRNVKNF